MSSISLFLHMWHMSPAIGWTEKQCTHIPSRHPSQVPAPTVLRVPESDEALAPTESSLLLGLRLAFVHVHSERPCRFRRFGLWVVTPADRHRRSSPIVGGRAGAPYLRHFGPLSLLFSALRFCRFLPSPRHCPWAAWGWVASRHPLLGNRCPGRLSPQGGRAYGRPTFLCALTITIGAPAERR